MDIDKRNYVLGHLIILKLLGDIATLHRTLLKIEKTFMYMLSPVTTFTMYLYR